MDKKKLREIVEKAFADTCNYIFDTTYFNDVFIVRLYNYVDDNDLNEEMWTTINKYVQKCIASLPL